MGFRRTLTAGLAVTLAALTAGCPLLLVDPLGNEGGGGSGGTGPPGDVQPPQLSGNTFGGLGNGTFESGTDTLHVRIHAEDDKALRTLGYELVDPSRGQVARRDSVLVSGRVVDDTLLFPLPLNLALPVPSGTPFQGSLFARDTAGNTAMLAVNPILVEPPASPSVTGTLSGATHDSAGALRDTLQISVTASSPRTQRPLTYLGYRLTNFVSVGDSVAASGTSGAYSFRVPIPFAWKGLLLTLEIFARDRLGLEARRALGNVRVVVFPSRPTQTFRVGQGVSDVAFDAVRNRVYLTTAVDTGPATGSPEVRVFQLSPPGFLPGIPLPWASDGLDLSPGGDSLLVTLYNNRLGIINLSTLSRDSTDPIAFTPSNGRYPFRVRALANGKAMVSIASAYWGDGSPGQLVEIDLKTRAQTLRTDVGVAGGIGLTPLLARSSDRQRLLVFSSSPTTTAGQLYQATSNQFAASVAVTGPSLGGGGASGDRTGAIWLVGNSLLGNNLASLRLLGATSALASASAISDDGTLAYVAVPEGVAKFRTSDGVQLELILLPDAPYRLLVTPDGTTLIALGPPGLEMVDLR